MSNAWASKMPVRYRIIVSSWRFISPTKIVRIIQINNFFTLYCTFLPNNINNKSVSLQKISEHFPKTNLKMRLTFICLMAFVANTAFSANADEARQVLDLARKVNSYFMQKPLNR